MPTYTLNHDYEAYRDGQRFGPWTAGEQVSLDEPDAQWVNRDSPGCLTPGGADLEVGRPVPAGGARPRVGGDPDKAEAAAAAQEQVHAESAARVTPPADEEPAEESTEDDGKKPAKDRAHRTGRNRSN